MRTCNHTGYLSQFWGKYLLDQSSLKKTRSHHQQNSESGKEHEKFPLEAFPTCCINKDRVCWSFPPTSSIFCKRSMLSLKNETRLSSRHHLFYRGVCVCVCFFLYLPAFLVAFSHSLGPPQRNSSREQLVPHIGHFPQTWGVGDCQEINGCFFSPLLRFYVWTDMASALVIHSAALFPFRCASLQGAEISGGSVSNCLSHLVFNLLRSGL